MLVYPTRKERNAGIEKYISWISLHFKCPYSHDCKIYCTIIHLIIARFPFIHRWVKDFTVQICLTCKSLKTVMDFNCLCLLKGISNISPAAHQHDRHFKTMNSCNIFSLRWIANGFHCKKIIAPIIYLKNVEIYTNLRWKMFSLLGSGSFFGLFLTCITVKIQFFSEYKSNEPTIITNSLITSIQPLFTSDWVFFVGENLREFRLVNCFFLMQHLMRF